MPRKKSNSKVELHPGFWCDCVVDDFVKQTIGNALPESWGGNVTQRYGSAVFVAWVSVVPAELELAQGASKAGSEPGCERQIAFSRLFTLAPDYFVALVRYVRERRAEIAQIASVATALHFEGHNLLYSDDGSLRTDKEVAAVLEGRSDRKLAGLHPSVIGKARRYIADSHKRLGEAQIERFFEAGSGAMTFLWELATRQDLKVRVDAFEDEPSGSAS